MNVYDDARIFVKFESHPPWFNVRGEAYSSLMNVLNRIKPSDS